MTLLFMDGMDHYNDAQILDKWDVTVGGVDYKPGDGRFGGGAMEVANAEEIGKTVPGDPTMFVGFAWANISTQSSDDFIDFRNQTDNLVHVRIRALATGAIEAYRGPSSTLLGTSAAGVLQQSGYQHIEIKVTVDDSAGVVEIRVDETVVLNLTAQDTRNGGTTANIEQVRFHGAGGSTAPIRIDDVVIYDNQGSKNNNFLGDRRIYTLYPDADTADADFTRSAGANNFENVDETQTDEDTTYNFSSTIGQRDRYGVGNLGVTPDNVDAVAVTCHARKTDAGTRDIELILESGGSESLSGALTLQSGYGFFQHIVETNPNGGGAWTGTTVDAVTIGQEVKN